MDCFVFTELLGSVTEVGHMCQRQAGIDKKNKKKKQERERERLTDKDGEFNNAVLLEEG